jgi:hypothetical protein
MKWLWFILFILIVFEPSHAFFYKNKIAKGNIVMDAQILPLEVKAKESIVVTSSLKYNNRFACLIGSSEFALASVNEKLQVTVDVVSKNVPGIDYAGVFGANETGKFFWCKSGWREAILYDTESKKLIKKMASYNGNTFINAFFAVAAKDNYVYVSVLDADGPQTFPVFDFLQNDPVAVISKFYLCFFLQGQNDSCLLVDTDQKKTRNWQNAILKKNDIYLLPDDSLTTELTKKQFRYRSEKKAYDFNKRIIIGMGIDKLVEPFSVRWNPDKTEIKIEPLILQCPKPDIFGENWEISPDGNWCINKATRNWDTKTQYEAIVFYQVDNSFPNGLSTPIYGGLTSEDNKGCFINHDVLGPLYLDIPPSGDPVIYKLNQIPELLKNAAK